MAYMLLTRRGAEQMLARLDEATPDKPLLIGRGQRCDMQVPDRSVARHQAAVFRQGDRYRLLDRSGKKTLLNGQPVEAAWLEDRDYLDLGPFRAHFHDATPADDGDEPSRVETLVDARGRPAEPVLPLPEQLWVYAQKIGGGKVLRAALRAGLKIGTARSCGLRLPDDRLVSGEHAQVVRVDGCLFLHDLGSTNGTWLRGVSVKEAALPLGEWVRLGDHRCWVSAEKEDGEAPAWLFEGIIGRHELMLRLFEQILLVALSEAAVSIHGETGSGKDLVAQAIHRRSNRAAGPFVAINCATIAREVFESHLFGSEKGAFTGAVADRPGLIASADGGTIFLDEIGELPLDLQAKLLRTLETGEVLRVGAVRPIHVDVRFVAGTHRDLHAMARVGLFREDLIYRLNVLTVEVPPLRRRLDDLFLLWDHLAKRHARRPMRPALSPEVKRILMAHRWPGNVRELQNVVQRAFAFMQGPDLLPEHIVFDQGAAPLPPPIESFLAADALSLEQVEILSLRAALQRNKGHRAKAAAELQIGLATLKRKIAEYGLEREGLPDEEEGEE